MTGREITIALGRRSVPVVLGNAGGSMTLAFERGDLVLLTPEEAERAIAAGIAVPAKLLKSEGKEGKT